MTEKEIKARYKRAVFGFLWLFLNPLLQMAVIGFVFSFFIKIPNYFLFLFSGLLVWTFFSSTTSKAASSIVYERSLLQKAKFPIEAIPVSIVLSSFIHMIISFAIFFLILIALGNLVFPEVLLVIPAILWILVFTIGLSLLFASLTVYFRDVSFFVQTLLTLWFYATPVLYSIKIMPQALYPLFLLNPLTSIFELLHMSLLQQGSLDFNIIISNLLFSFLIVLAGLIVFNKQHKFFIDWL